NVTATLKGNTQVTASYPGFPDGSQTIPMNYINVQAPTDFEAHYLAGLDIGSVWSIVGEANGPSLSLNTSFRAEF
ncbi:MAG TPA: hypothetical protein VFR02_07975, partial [bacterium]|nr:hypothetical protein [bacterium]